MSSPKKMIHKLFQQESISKNSYKKMGPGYLHWSSVNVSVSNNCFNESTNYATANFNSFKAHHWNWRMVASCNASNQTDLKDRHLEREANKLSEHHKWTLVNYLPVRLPHFASLPTIFCSNLLLFTWNTYSSNLFFPFKSKTPRLISTASLYYLVRLVDVGSCNHF